MSSSAGLVDRLKTNYPSDRLQDALNRLEQHQGLSQSVRIFQTLPDFPDSYLPLHINIYVDDIWISCWNRRGSEPVINFSLPPDIDNAILEVEVDGESAFVSIAGVVLLDRISSLRHQFPKLST